MRLKSIRALRRMVFYRLAAVTVIVCTIAVALVFVSERSRISDQVLERARAGTILFGVAAGDLLEQPGLPNRQALEQALGKLMNRRDPDAIGRFVFAGFYGPDGKALAESFNPYSQRLDAIRSAVVRSHPSFQMGPPQPFQKTIWIAEVPYVDVFGPMTNRSGQQVTYGRGLFEVSPESLAATWQRVRRTILIILLIVLAAGAVLYPIILRLIRRVSNVSDDLLASNLGTLEVLGSAIAKRDCDTDTHNYRATIYCVRLAEAIGLEPEFIRALIKGALLHDVGKIGVRDSILLKPGRLTEEEFEEMKHHVRYGVDIINRSDWLKDAKDVVGYHHEKFDGSGYDGALSGEAIPQAARIFAIADVFDALTSRRPYKEPMELKQAVEILLRERGSHFDPAMIDVFVPLAQGLYDKAMSRSDEATHQELQAILNHYYQDGVGVLL